MKKFWTVLLAATLAFGALDADAARRLGGGGSVGRQSSNVTQRQQQASPQPGAPAQSAQPKPAPSPQAAPQPAPAKRPWGAMLGGLAAGLGLAWLAHSLGLGSAFGSVLMVLLLALIGVAIVGALLRRRTATPAYAMPGGGPVAATPPVYSPDKVGNDASARPWERSSMAFEPAKVQGASGLGIGSALQGTQNWGIPEGFDVDGFLTASKRNFVTLQEAWDAADIPRLRAMMTDEMLGEIRSQLAERDRTGGGPNRTEVVMLEAQLLGIEDVGKDWMASVEFSGMIREEPSAGPSPFREVWNMTKPKDGSAGWLVAGVQALQ